MNFNLGFLERLRYRFKTLEHKYQQYRRTTNETLIADTEYGKIKGVKRLSLYDVPYYSFEGIPYAQPPVGELRFKAPQRPIPWEQVLDCTNNRDKPVQVNVINGQLDGSEDCLYLNVYTNNLKPDKPRPVMVWIHGGGFYYGEASREAYSPDYLIEQDIVLICIQYRLGVLGFLNLDTPELNVPGNAGLKDMVMALRWIKSNCANFGGNPDNITIFGESAGGAATHCMMLTDQTQGLFHRAVLMSGNSIAAWATSTDRAKYAFSIAQMAGYKGENNEKEVLQFLMQAKAKDLVALQDKVLTLEDRKQKKLFAFGPTVETNATPERVLPQGAREMMKTAWGNSLPVLTGNTSSDGMLMYPYIKPVLQLALQETANCENFVPLEVAEDPEMKRENGLKLKKAHVAGDLATVDEYLDIYTHSLFLFPMHRFLLSRLSHATAPSYVYRFDFDSDALTNSWRLWRYSNPHMKGVSHTDDFTYIFGNSLSHRMPEDSKEYRTIKRMVGILTQFAATGNPNGDQIPGMDALTWEPIKKDEKVYKCLNIGEELKVIDLPEMAKIKAWESTFEKKPELLY